MRVLILRKFYEFHLVSETRKEFNMIIVMEHLYEACGIIW